ncbi:hypothetical protein QFZ42_002388 [Variovorax paradoxus]|nr:hypothetical protein [Variovorax paradoxus]
MNKLAIEPPSFIGGSDPSGRAQASRRPASG